MFNKDLFQLEHLSNSINMNLKVVGAGHLGIRIAVLWKESFPEASVFLKTKHNVPERSAKWQSLGYVPLSEEEENDSNRIKAPFVVFCAPPTNNPDYAKDVETSIQKDWHSDSNENKAFVFTGSGGVYAENSGGVIDEDSETSSVSERSKALLSAEQSVEKFGGVTIRFGGLYTKTRGAHNFWLGDKAKEFTSSPNGLINLIHYDDAARCVISALLKSSSLGPESSKKLLFLASDGVPISRENICRAALKCPFYKEKAMPTFSGEKSVVDGKRYNTMKIRQTLDWKPVFTSFEEFMSAHYDEEINVSQFFG